jgi:hypothetical protein
MYTFTARSICKTLAGIDCWFESCKRNSSETEAAAECMQQCHVLTHMSEVPLLVCITAHLIIELMHITGSYVGSHRLSVTESVTSAAH